MALLLCILVTCLWTFWGVTEMFHEGWYAPFEWMFFLLPAGACLVLTLVALAWPRSGGGLLIVIGIAFYAVMLWRAAARSALTLAVALSWFPPSGFLAFVGGLFLLKARRDRESAGAPYSHGWRRNLPFLLAIGVPLLFGLALAAAPAIRVANRIDDGDCGARLIQGNGVALTRAPDGPGWTVGVS